jgi:hypothetical protein
MDQVAGLQNGKNPTPLLDRTRTIGVIITLRLEDERVREITGPDGILILGSCSC